MKRLSLAGLAVAVLAVLPLAASAQHAPAACQFIRNFKRLHDRLPDTIGSCTSRRIFAANGDVLQYTTNGLIVRRKADNWTAFTDGHITFIDGPHGLVSRSNADRFTWERQTKVAQAENLPEPEQRVGPAGSYPNSALTPGATDPRVTPRNVRKTICAANYAASMQPAAAYASRIMQRQLARYHAADTDSADYTLDYVVPIELGGDPDAPSNMWPMPNSQSPGPQEKQRAAAYLHDQVCAGAMSLDAAQHAMLNDWVAVYEQLPGD